MGSIGAGWAGQGDSQEEHSTRGPTADLGTGPEDLTPTLLLGCVSCFPCCGKISDKSNSRSPHSRRGHTSPCWRVSQQEQEATMLSPPSGSRGSCMLVFWWIPPFFSFFFFFLCILPCTRPSSHGCLRPLVNAPWGHPHRHAQRCVYLIP